MHKQPVNRNTIHVARGLHVCACTVTLGQCACMAHKTTLLYQTAEGAYDNECRGVASFVIYVVFITAARF